MSSQRIQQIKTNGQKLNEQLSEADSQVSVSLSCKMPRRVFLGDFNRNR